MIQVALERSEEDRETCVNLFREGYMADLFRKEEIRRGFDLVYIDLDQILIDNPRAIELLMKMLLRAICDLHLFPESLLARMPEVVMNLKT